MSKTKFLGIPAGGKRAGWIEMEGGSSAGGGGGYVMELNPGDYSQDSSGLIIDDVSYDPLYEAISQGRHAVIKMTMEQDVNTQTSFVAVIYSELRAGGLYCYARMNDFDMVFKFYNGSYHSA